MACSLIGLANEEALSIAALAALILIGLIWTISKLRRSPYTPLQSALYLANVLLTRVLWRTTIDGEFSIPPDRGAVIVCNHGSSIDPFFIQLTPQRVVHWMVAREYTDFILFRDFFRTTGSIPTNRAGIDTAATRAAIRYASEGQLVGMLPEGRINATPKLLLPGRPGAALVALRAEVPVVPCFIRGAPYDGTFWGCFFMTAKVHLTIGQPVDLSEYFGRHREEGVLREVTLRILREIAAVAGEPNFEPELAGRRWKPGMEEETAVANDQEGE